jgi:hypothetical protein
VHPSCSALGTLALEGGVLDAGDTSNPGAVWIHDCSLADPVMTGPLWREV